MAEFRIVPTILAGKERFEVRRATRFVFWTVWAFECFTETRESAEQACVHLGGPVTHVSTEE